MSAARWRGSSGRAPRAASPGRSRRREGIVWEVAASRALGAVHVSSSFNSLSCQKLRVTLTFMRNTFFCSCSTSRRRRRRDARACASARRQKRAQHIAETARRLFGARGFERVTSPRSRSPPTSPRQTVFNYFPSKEDLFYSGLEAFETAAARRRSASGRRASRRWPPSAASSPSRAGCWPARPRDEGAPGGDDADDRGEPGAAGARAEDPRRLHRLARRAAAEETGAKPDDVEPWVAANAMIGVHRALIGFARAEDRRGRPQPRASPATSAPRPNRRSRCSSRGSGASGR